MRRFMPMPKLITGAAVVVIVLAACSNPFVAQIKEQITNDVTTALQGEPPQLLSADPADSDSDVPTSATVTLTFDMALDPASVTTDSV